MRQVLNKVGVVNPLEQLKNENLIDKGQEDVEQLNNSLNKLLSADDHNLIHEDKEQEQLQHHINYGTKKKKTQRTMLHYFTNKFPKQQIINTHAQSQPIYQCFIISQKSFQNNNSLTCTISTNLPHHQYRVPY